MAHNVLAIIDSFAERKLDLNEKLIKHPAATFFVRVSGSSMRHFGVIHDDILVVDRSLEPRNGRIVVAVIDGEFVLKKIFTRELSQFVVWGVVTNIIHKV